MALQFGVSYADTQFEYVRVRRWPFTIGRSHKNDLCLTKSERVSRRHARVIRQGPEYYFVLLGSNPTFLNGEQLREQTPAVIRPGDVIELPDYALEFRESPLPVRVEDTANVLVASNSAIIVRKVASTIGARKWTVDGIHGWLSEHEIRAIRIKHDRIQLWLASDHSRDQIRTRLELFDELMSMINPRDVIVEIVDRRRVHSGP